MKERPILFSAPMVQAILAGNKTQTRRVVKMPKKAKWGTEYDGQVIIDDGSTFGQDIEVDELKCPHGKVGDFLWVRETWACVSQCSDWMNRSVVFVENYAEHGWTIQYRASTHCEFEGDWRPSIFMPRWASRILLEITGVRVERLHDISEQDALAEGIENKTVDNNVYFKDYVSGNFFKRRFDDGTEKQSYFSLWQSINGHESLKANPWVWVIEFKVIEAK